MTELVYIILSEFFLVPNANKEQAKLDAKNAHLIHFRRGFGILRSLEVYLQ